MRLLDFLHMDRLWTTLLEKTGHNKLLCTNSFIILGHFEAKLSAVPYTWKSMWMPCKMGRSRPWSWGMILPHGRTYGGTAPDPGLADTPRAHYSERTRLWSRQWKSTLKVNKSGHKSCCRYILQFKWGRIASNPWNPLSQWSMVTQNIQKNSFT